MSVLDDARGVFYPMLIEYIRILRNHVPNYPKRSWSRNAGSKCDIDFWVDMVELPNSFESPGPIRISIKLNNELVFRGRIGYNAAMIVLDGLRADTVIDADVCKMGDWVDDLDTHINYLVREARLSY